MTPSRSPGANASGMISIVPSIEIRRTGLLPYADAWALQRRLAAEQLARRGDAAAPAGTLLLLEHPPVYTLGKNTDRVNLLFTDDELRARGAEVFEIDRGGDVTFHGPGQLVGYPILDLERFKPDLHWYMRSLEEAIIRALSAFGIAAGRINGLTGVWVGEEKICAIGTKCSRWITGHGFALNVATDLSWFDAIIPCGIPDHGVTSMERVLGRAVEMERVMYEVARGFGQVFLCKISSPDYSWGGNLENFR